jgi:O-antigen/teichoic acid export membrane protein
MNIERTKNTKRNIFFGFINKFVSLLLPFILRTVIIQILGVEYLGLNSLFSSILQVLSLAELGFGNAMVYNMYVPIAENDYKTICALLKLYRYIYRIIGAVVLILGIILLPFLPNLIKGDSPVDVNIYILFVIYLVNTVLTYWLFGYKASLLYAFQRNDIISNIDTIIKILLNMLQFFVLFLLKNYYIYLILLPICTIINNVMTMIAVNKLFPQYKCEGVLDKKTLYNIKKNVIGLSINKICATTRNSFDSIFISAFIGLTVTAIYANYYYVMNAVIVVISVITSSMLAGVGNSIVCESKEKNYNDLKKINFLYMWLSGWSTICMACLFQPFMNLWVGEKLMFDYPVVILFCCYFYVLKMGDIRALYSDAAGLWWENRYRALIESFANIILNWLLVKYMGVNGIILATLLSLFIINFGFGSRIVFHYYFQNKKLGEYFLLHSKYAIVTIGIAIATYYFVNKITIRGWFGLFIRFISCCFFPNIIYLIVYHKTYEYKISILWLFKTLHLKKLKY